MDHLIISLTEAKTCSGFDGKTAEFKKSRELVEFCIKNNKIVDSVHPSEMNDGLFNFYFNHLLNMTRTIVSHLTDFNGIDDLKNRPAFRKSFKILWEFGVIGEIRNHSEGSSKLFEDQKRSATSITIKELYEVALVQLSFSGSELAFKKQVQRLYGSFAEYCIEKGYDINTTKWESNETALRVAKKIGSIEAVKNKSKSLYKYLLENNLTGEAFDEAA